MSDLEAQLAKRDKEIAHLKAVNEKQTRNAFASEAEFERKLDVAEAAVKEAKQATREAKEKAAEQEETLKRKIKATKKKVEREKAKRRSGLEASCSRSVRRKLGSGGAAGKQQQQPVQLRNSSAADPAQSCGAE